MAGRPGNLAFGDVAQPTSGLVADDVAVFTGIKGHQAGDGVAARSRGDIIEADVIDNGGQNDGLADGELMVHRSVTDVGSLGGRDSRGVSVSA